MKKFLLPLFILPAFCIQAFAGQPKSVTAQSIVVTATRSQAAFENVPGSISVITPDQIRDMGAEDLLDIVRETAGISLIGKGVGGRNVISVRGMDSRHSLVLIDGNRIAATDNVFGHSDFENDWMPIDNIERVEVVRGPLSALYGSDAMGGVINIITKKSHDKWMGGIKAGGGVKSNGDGGELQNYSAWLNGPLFNKKFGLNIAAEYLNIENTPDPDEPQYSELEAKKVTSLETKLTFTPADGHIITARIDMINDDRVRDNNPQGTRGYVDNYDLEKRMFSLGWHGNYGSVQADVKAYRSKADKISKKTYGSGKIKHYPEKLVDDVFDAQVSYAMSSSHLMTLGGELRHQTLDSISLISGSDDVKYKGLFFQDEWMMFSNRFFLTPGLRWDDHEVFGSEWSPRLYVLYKLSDKFNLKAGYGHAFRAPSIKQASADYFASMGPHSFKGNPDVTPEISDSWEAGFEYFRDGVFFRAMYFHNKIDDLIAYTQIAKKGKRRTMTTINVDEAKTAGLETELSMSLPKGFDIKASYTYLDAEDTEKNIRLEGRPRHTTSARLSYTSSYGLSASMQWQYIADQQLKNDDKKLVDAPDYYLLNFSMSQKFIDRFEIQAGVDNITDVRLADKSDMFLYEERGRFFFANIKYSF